MTVGNAREKYTAYEHLAKLQKLSASLIKAQTSKDIARIIIKEGFDVLGAICGDVSLFDKETKKVTVIAKKGYTSDIIHEFESSVGKTPLLTMEVITLGKPFYIQDVAKLEKKYTFAKYFIELTQSRAAALLPLKTRDKVIGVLQLAFKDPQAFTVEEKQLMSGLSYQCAQALDKMIALEEARNSKDELDTILKTIDDGVIVRNNEGIITFVNPATLRMHSCKSADELLGLTLEQYFSLFSKVLDVKGNPVPLDAVPFYIADKETKHIKNIYFKVFKKTGHAYWWQITSLPIRNGEGVVQFIVSVIHDITEEKQNEYSKDEFFGIASHELKTPVTSLKAYTQVLKKRFEKEGNIEVAGFLQKMDTQIDKLTNLIHDLLDVTKIEAGRLQFHNELFEFNILAKEIVDELQLVTEHAIIFHNNLQDAVLFGDKDRVGQVITNLLTNALKYSTNNKEVIVRIRKEKGYVHFSVQDFGIGIAKEDQKHIFERFYRERNLKGDTFPGLGLGLYIASEIIKRLHGKIWVESEKGKGSTFYFKLPLAKKQI